MPCQSKSNGPDWMDWGTLGATIRSTHSVSLAVSIEPRMTGSTPIIKVACAASWPDVSKPHMLSVVSVEAVFPSVNHATLDGLIYRLLWELDRDLSDRYEPLPMFPVGD